MFEHPPAWLPDVRRSGSVTTLPPFSWNKKQPRNEFGQYAPIHTEGWDVLRFWEKVDQSQGDDGCWEWQAACNDDGYGNIGINGRTRRAHRVAWHLTHGPIPQGLHVLHHCDNRKCVNPAHLFLGTNLDNIRDRQQKGRRLHPIDGRNPNAKLTCEAVKEMRQLSKAGMRTSDLMRRFGVSKRTVRRIIRGIAWSTCND